MKKMGSIIIIVLLAGLVGIAISFPANVVGQSPLPTPTSITIYDWTSPLTTPRLPPSLPMRPDTPPATKLEPPVSDNGALIIEAPDAALIFEQLERPLINSVKTKL